MNATIAFDIDLSPCAAHHKALSRLGIVEASVGGLLESQRRTNVAYCCPACGDIWAREQHLTSEPFAWTFEPSPCGGPLLSALWLDYLLTCDLSPQEMRFIIHEYSRCYEHYSLDRSGSRPRGGVPSVEQL